ncbi:uncharacterized protein LOC114516181 [Dendronephthya gigantea]|uniref:uncharacterized protein LOC114516181 n=1 Tax=Dendronephthya gigantea TaxID=151771 RepID=UPI00106C0C6F|nr:uncharacterized protein LOC114516181 [Dendronephthya gigantea]
MKPVKDLLDKANDIVDNVWDDNCLKTVRELPCMPIYCSENDDNIVEMKNKRKDCTKAMECVSKSTEKLNSITGKALESVVDELRDAIKDSCETIIKTFEDLSKPSAKEASGVSDVQITISLTLVPVFLCFKMLY